MKKNVPKSVIGTNITGGMRLIELQKICNKISKEWDTYDTAPMMALMK
jgi:hypothetical protein